VFAELRALVLKTSGLADVLREALTPVADKVRAAFVYGSIAKGQDTAASDIDLMVISERLTYADLFGTLEDASAHLGRKVAPTIYSPQGAGSTQEAGQCLRHAGSRAAEAVADW
jgi:predicted nucleotidyltransferase